MKAIVQDKFGSPDDLPELKEIDKPVAAYDEVLAGSCCTSGYSKTLTGLSRRLCTSTRRGAVIWAKLPTR